MPQQIALLTLEQITYTGGNVGTQFAFTFDVAGEHNEFEMTVNQGPPKVVTEHLGAKEWDPANGPFPMPVAVHISGNAFTGPVQGSSSTTLTILPSPTEQVFNMNVVIVQPFGPPATFDLRYRCRYREYPVSYNPEWLCNNRYDWSAFSRWLCLGDAQIVGFSSMPEIVSLGQVFTNYTDRLQRISDDLALGFAPAGVGFFDTQEFTFDVVMGAALSIPTLPWGRIMTLEDFTQTVSDKMEDYMIAVHTTIDFEVLELCRRWRELLDCFCKYCQNRFSLPQAAVTYYDANIAPEIDALFPQIEAIATTEGMPAALAPWSPAINCDKLTYIVSFWAWWCKVCPLTNPPWGPGLDGPYNSLYNKRALLNDILEANSYKLCNPPEKNFCNRWSAVLDCLKKICLASGDLPPALITDMESTFGTYVRNLATFLKLPNIAPLMGAGIGNTCQLLEKIKKYFDSLCPQNVIPGGRIRRTQLDTYLLQFETAMSGFKTRNGDLCAPTVKMTGCNSWLPPLDCLKNLCDRKIIFTDELRQEILDDFTTVINDLFTMTDPPSPPPGATGIDLLCFKISHVRDFFGNYCPDKDIDPILKLRLESKLAALQAAHTALLADFPDLCDETVDIPSTWCDSWETILDCLKRICKRSSRLHPDILDYVAEEFGPIIDLLVWLSDDPVDPYQADTLTFQQLCAELDGLLDFINDICSEGEIDPVLKLRLDEQLELLQGAYAALLAEYPGICADPDPFCEEWVEMLDCLTRLDDRARTNPFDQIAINTIDLAVDVMGTGMTSVYEIVYGQPVPGVYPAPRDRFSAEMSGLLGWFGEHCVCCGSTASQQIRTQLAAPQVTMMAQYRNLVACDASCTTTTLSLTTGIAPWMVTQIDNLVLSTPRTPNIVTGTSGISAPISGSDWISPHPTATDSVIGVTIFRRCFCVCTDGTIRIQFNFRADDTADIYLDNTLVYSAVSNNMVTPESFDVTVSVGAGRHCIRAEVTNNPTVNMAYCGNGTITAVTATLLDDDCCGDDETPLPPCADIPTWCDRIVQLPRMFQYFCCPQRASNDPIFSTTAYQDILTALTCFEGQINSILIGVGQLPNSIPLEGGSTFCSRLRRAVRVMLAAYLDYRMLTPLIRRRIDCFHELLRLKISELAATEIDRPIPCTDTCDVCTKWLDLLECLCNICIMRPKLVSTHPALASLIDDLLCMGPATGPAQFTFQSSYYCCEYLMSSFSGVLDHCLCCTDTPGALEPYESEYELLSGIRTTLVNAFTAAGLIACEEPCRSWSTMLDCLVKLCLRRNELPQALRDRFDQLFATRVGNVYTDLFNAAPPSSPFAADVFGATCWRLHRMLREFERRCTPLYVWNAITVKALAARFNDFRATYNTFMGELAAAGVGFCSQKADVCDRLHRLPELFRTFCATTPSASAAPVIAIEALLTQVRNDIPSIQRQLQLPLTAYPLAGSFCERLDFTVGVMATAGARYDELARTYRTVVDLFFAIYRQQADAYAVLIVNDLPRAATPMTEYRDQWTELLNCICRACDFVAGLNAGELVTYAEIVDFFDGGVATLSNAINDLYSRVIVIAPQLGVPLVIDPCADTLCEKVRIIISFFSLYCLRCNEPATVLVSHLETALDLLRVATVALRGAMQRAGRVVCTDENLETTAMQSPSLYLQAAGSNNDDGTSTGVHLRWALLDTLGDHIPKGNLAKPGTDYYGTNPFNRKDDFVRIFRAPYGPGQRFAAEIDLATDVPDTILGSIAEGVTWTFNSVSYDPTFTDAVTTIQISFEAGKYPTPIPATPSSAHVQTVRQNYTGAYRVEAIPKLMFAVEVDIVNPGASPSVKFEAISRNDDPSVDDPNFVSARLQINGATNPHRIESESMEYVLFQCVSCIPGIIRLETFDDFYVGSKRHYLWKRFGEFGLSLDDTEVYKRLEDPTRYVVDGQWPKFSTDDPSAPLMRVRVENYKDRWIPRQAPVANPAAGIYNRPARQSLRAVLVKYLEKSTNSDNVEAWTTEYSLMPDDKTAMKLSLLEILQLGAQDYHIARMLGLGAIDWQVTDSSKRYIYMAEYEAPEPLLAERPANPLPPTVHRYLSLPTGQLDWRLPVTPELKPLVKGLDKPYTNDEGYTRFGTHRYMQLHRDELKFDLPVGEFFQGFVGFSRGLQSRPMLFGVKYGSMTTSGGTPEWAIPDPSNDASEAAGPEYHPYIDHDGKPEVVAIPDLKGKDGKPTPALFTHRIKRGNESKPWHKYAIYGINWFSRVSPSMNFSESFHNNFPVLNMLQPPLNLKVQYLQYEDVPILNAPSENVASFFGKTRVTFDWNQTHDLAYQFADEVHFYVRTSEPKRLRGKIKDVDLVDATIPYAWVTTDSYEDVGNLKTEVIEPAIATADIGRFIGSMLVTPSERFEILDVVRDGTNNNYAKFKVKAVLEAAPDGKMELGEKLVPLVDELFLVVENINTIDDLDLGLPDWRRLDGHKMKLVQFAPHTESIVTSGRSEEVRIGGLLHPNATVVRREGVGPEAGLIVGLYDVTLPGVTLGTYASYFPGSTLDVSFYKGTLRVKEPADTTKVRSLEVLKIIQTSPDLKLLVFDPEDRMLQNVTSPMWANFHPSYRIYIEWQAKELIDPAATFEPAAPELSRLTYMAAKGVHTAMTDGTGQPYRSPATPPAVHLARLVIPLLPPAEPAGPEYASRPDFYGKASYTFDTAFPGAHRPYGMMFYRADEMALLMALYRMDTIRDVIIPELPEHRGDDINARWRTLIDVQLDGEGKFPLYNNFRFPNPDKGLEPGYHGPYATAFNGAKLPSAIVEEIREAIRNAFIPLTESYVAFGQIKESATLQTSSKKPVLRAVTGELLNQNDPAQNALFDPYPMIRKSMPGDPNFRVRFTDYTLDGASRNIYFYFTREVSSGLAAGDPSVVKGPVRLVNTFPPVAPQVAKVRVNPENAVLETKPEVIFQFNPPPVGERISEIWIYRALDEADARNIRTMKRLAPVVPAADLATDAQFEVRDTFADIQPNESIPYGQPLYYRVVVARRITNENGEEELVPSLPSETIMVSVMDTVNPKPPVIEAEYNEVMAPAPNQTKPLEFTDVVLKWPHTTYNATYRLYKLSPQGQWTLVKTFAPPHAGTEIVYDWSADPNNAPELLKFSNDTVLYHRFKVVVTNSSGLVSLIDEVKVI